MATKTRLSEKLLIKLVEKTGKPKKYVREQISKRAARLGISSEAAQIAWARDLGIGTANAIRNLDPHKQDQVRSTLYSSLHTTQPKSRVKGVRNEKTARTADPIILAANYLLTDNELRSRCNDLLRSKRHQDRVFREATVVLENRIRRLGGITERINPSPLVSRVLNPDPSKAILVFSSEPSEQQGFHSICLGIILSFRDKAHHALDDKITREDALKFCAFVDVILGRLSTATKRD